MQTNLYNIPASCSFTDTLAQRFSELYTADQAGLSKVVFLVPNRRTAISLKEAFIRHNGLKPAVLPRILPVGDLDDEDIFLQPGEAESLLKELPPAIDPFERLFLFARLIAAKPRDYGLAPMTLGQAFSLAQDLSKLLDAVYNEKLSLADLNNLVPEQYAAHWQETLKFLRIIMAYWPQILKERGVIDLAERKNILLDLQSERLKHHPPADKIVAAGVTGAFPGLKKLLAAVCALPQGELYFYNLDRLLDDEAWKAVDENHSQYEHKQLLEYLQKTRDDVKDCALPHNSGREKLASEMMRPAPDTWRWRDLNGTELPPCAVEGLRIINCDDSRQEALTAALILRQTLNVPEKTAALVTSDRALARRTASELERWGIKIDDSAGRPLHLTPVGIFLRLIAFVPEKSMAESAVLSLLKNPLTHLNEETPALRQKVRQWEKLRRMPRFDEQERLIPEQLQQIIRQFQETIRPLVEIYDQTSVSFKIMLETHVRVAEALSGAQNLWRGEDGRQAATLISKVLPYADIIGDIEPTQYLNFLTTLLATQQVRSNYASHPRIKILGPIEARYNSFDTVIIGGVNEGVWPAAASGDPWLSRPMKKEFGMPLPERAVGVAAADFSQLLCVPEVYLTRAARSGGTPMNKSRWLLRLETVLTAAGYPLEKFYTSPFGFICKSVDSSDKTVRINPPSPKPPLSARPRRLSASAIEKLMRDPYEIFAAKILNIKPLHELDIDLLPSDYGNLVHKILEKFCLQYPDTMPQNALDILLQLGGDEFARKQIPAETRAFWWPKFAASAAWFVQTENIYRQDIAKVYGEVRGSYEFESAGGKFILEARADRIDRTKDGKINIIDYKTGHIRSNKEMECGYAPQLPLEGLIAAKGCFTTTNNNEQIGQADVGELIYRQLGEKSQTYNKDTHQLIEDTEERLKKLITVFDFEDTPYTARPNPKHLPEYADYEHLARIKEWADEGSDD